MKASGFRPRASGSVRALLALAMAVAGCTAASSDPGTGVELQVPGAQYLPGPFPAPTGGPISTALQTTHASVLIGRLHEQLHGILSPDSTGAIVGIAGVDGAWILPAGPPDLNTSQATVTATFGLAPGTPPGPFTLEVAATDSDGRIGTPVGTGLVADDAPPPQGDLVVELAWKSTADLDLHVIDPTGGEAYYGNANTWQRPPPGNPVDPCDYLTGGWLDRDANQDCTLNSAPSEHVVWTTRMTTTCPATAPVIPPGKYTVRVEAHAMCDDASAPWYVAVYHEGALIAQARGVATPDDVQQPHGKGAGLTALTFTLP